jgi:isopropylmalate/homocitrate/citramalate synthase
MRKKIRYVIPDLETWKNLIANSIKNGKQLYSIRSVSMSLELPSRSKKDFDSAKSALLEDLQIRILPTMQAVTEYGRAQEGQIPKHVTIKVDPKDLLRTEYKDLLTSIVKELKRNDIRMIWLHDISDNTPTETIRQVSRWLAKESDRQHHLKGATFGWHLRGGENGLTQMTVAISAGIFHFDTTFGGLGGSVATEEATTLLYALGAAKRTSSEILTRASRKLHHTLGSKLQTYRNWALYELPENELHDYQEFLKNQVSKWSKYFKSRKVNNGTAQSSFTKLLANDFEAQVINGTSLLDLEPQDETTIRSIQLAQERLGGLAAGFIWVSGGNGKGRLIMEKTQQLPLVLRKLLKENNNAEIDRLIKSYYELVLKLFKRKVMNWNSSPENFGVNSKGEVVLLNIGHLEDVNAHIAEGNPIPIDYFYQLGWNGDYEDVIMDISDKHKDELILKEDEKTITEIYTDKNQEPPQVMNWYPPQFLKLKKAALSWPNLIAGLFSIVLFLGWNFSQTNLISLQLAGILATIYFTSFFLHEAAHWLDVRYLKKEKPEWHFENGIGIKNSSGWVGIVTSSSLALLAYSLFPLSPPVIAFIVINLIFAGSIGDWKDLIQSIKESPEWLAEMTLTGFQEMLDVYSPRFADNHSPHKNLSHVRMNQLIILSATAVSVVPLLYLTQNNLSAPFIFNSVLALAFAQFIVNPLTHNLVNAFRLATGGSTAAWRKGQTIVNPQDKEFVLDNQDELNWIGDERKENTLRWRFIDGLTESEIASRLGLSMKYNPKLGPTIKNILKEFKLILKSGRPSIKKLVNDHAKEGPQELNRKLGKFYGRLIYNRHVENLSLDELSKTLRPKITRGMAGRHVKKAEELFLVKFGYADENDSSFVARNESVLKYIDTDPRYELIMRKIYLEEGNTYATVAKEIGMERSNVRRTAKIGLARLKNQLASGEPFPLQLLHENAHLLPRLKKKYQLALKAFYFENKSLQQIAEETKGSRKKPVAPSVVRGRILVAMNSLRELIAVDKLKLKIDHFFYQALLSEVDFNLLTPELIRKVRSSDSTIRRFFNLDKFNLTHSFAKYILDNLRYGHIEGIEGPPFSQEQEKPKSDLADAMAKYIKTKYPHSRASKTIRFPLNDKNSWENFKKWAATKNAAPGLRSVSLSINIFDGGQSSHTRMDDDQTINGTRAEKARAYVNSLLIPLLLEIKNHEKDTGVKIDTHLTVTLSGESYIDDTRLLEEILETLSKFRIDYLWLSDPKGHASPNYVRHVSKWAKTKFVKKKRKLPTLVGWQFKENGFGLINTLVAIGEGILWFDTTIKGFPFKEEARNVSSEETVSLLYGLGAPHKEPIPILARIGRQMTSVLGSPALKSTSSSWDLDQLSENQLNLVTNHLKSRTQQLRELTEDSIKIKQQADAHQGNGNDPDFRNIQDKGSKNTWRIPVDNLAWESFQLAQERLGGLILNALPINDILLTEPVTPLQDLIVQKFLKGDIEGAKKLITDYFETTISIFERGVINWNNHIRHFGVNKQGRVVLIHIGHLERTDDFLKVNGKPLNSYTESFGFGAAGYKELLPFTKDQKSFYGLRNGNDTLQTIKDKNKKTPPVKAFWLPEITSPTHKSKAALSWFNLILAAISLVAMLAWNYFDNEIFSFQLAGILAAIYFASFLAHEVSHWAELGFDWNNNPFQRVGIGIFSGIGAPGSRGGVGIKTSFSLAAISLILFFSLPSLSYFFLYSIIINLIFGFSFGDWKEILDSKRENEQAANELINLALAVNNLSTNQLKIEIEKLFTDAPTSLGVIDVIPSLTKVSIPENNWFVKFRDPQFIDALKRQVKNRRVQNLDPNKTQDLIQTLYSFGVSPEALENLKADLVIVINSPEDLPKAYELMNRAHLSQSVTLLVKDANTEHKINQNQLDVKRRNVQIIRQSTDLIIQDNFDLCHLRKNLPPDLQSTPENILLVLPHRMNFRESGLIGDSDLKSIKLLVLDQLLDQMPLISISEQLMIQLLGTIMAGRNA